MPKLTQTEYGFTASGSLANGGLYADPVGRVYFLTDDEAHQLSALPKQESKRVEITDAEAQEHAEIKAARGRYWQALVDIAGWENWQANNGGPTWREIAATALSSEDQP